MGNVEALLAHQSGNAAESQERDPDQHQRDTGHLQQERTVSLQVRTDEAEGGAQRDERRAEPGDEQRRIAQDAEVLTEGHGGACSRGAHIRDVGRHQRQDAGRRKGQQSGEKRQGQVDDHPVGLSFPVAS